MLSSTTSPACAGVSLLAVVALAGAGSLLAGPAGWRRTAEHTPSKIQQEPRCALLHLAQPPCSAICLVPIPPPALSFSLSQVVAAVRHGRLAACECARGAHTAAPGASTSGTAVDAAAFAAAIAGACCAGAGAVC